MRGSCFRIALNRFPVDGCGFRVGVVRRSALTPFTKQIAQANAIVTVDGMQPNGLAVFGFGFRELPLCPQGVCQVVV